MTRYYGFMVCLLTGEVKDLCVDCDYKPQHESTILSYAKWFTNESLRNKFRDYTINEIKENQKETLKMFIPNKMTLAKWCK